VQKQSKISDIWASISDASEATSTNCQMPGMCEFLPITTETS